MKNILRKLMILGIAAGLLGTASIARAAGNFDLLTADATLVEGENTVSTFFQVSGANVITAGGDLGYSSMIGGNADDGWFVTISFNGAQPTLESAFIKAANDYLWWDSADLADFNAGSFDSITLWNSGPNGIMNSNGKFNATSHAGINGTPGTSVPDGGTTAALLGLGLVGLSFVARRRRA